MDIKGEKDQTAYRLEKDSIGIKQIPKDAYYGINALRAAENFNITGLRLHKEFVKSLAQVKKAAAIANFMAGLLECKIKDAIIQACDEIVEGHFYDQFIVDPIQGGAGTSTNMNINEVIANRAIEILGGQKGDYEIVNPNDHVNMGQSTNDVIPTAGKLTILKLLPKVMNQLISLEKALKNKSKEFDDIVKMGRTQLQDAVPIRLGQEFSAYASVIGRDISRFENAKHELLYVNLGGTAIGTSINADKKYVETVVPILRSITNIELKQAANLIDATQNLDCFSVISGVIKTCAINLSKLSNDLRLMSSGPRAGFGEINLPAKQNGSSIMPGKINPVIPEVMNQVAFNIIGNDVTVTMAVEAGQLELNAFEPIIFYKIFESLETLEMAIKTFVENCITGITANKERCHKLVSDSVGIITPLARVIGYKKAAEMARTAINTGEPIKNVLLKQGILDENQINKILDVASMTKISC